MDVSSVMCYDMAEKYRDVRENETAIKYYMLSIEMSMKDDGLVMLALFQIEGICQERGDLKDAINYYLMAIKMEKLTRNEISWSMYEIARMYRKIGNIKNAIEYYEIAYFEYRNALAFSELMDIAYIQKNEDSKK